MGNPKRDLAKKWGFLAYVDEDGIQLLEKQLSRFGFVFVERLSLYKNERYQAYYARFDEAGSIVKETLLLDKGEYEEAIENANQFILWMSQKRQQSKKG